MFADAIDLARHFTRPVVVTQAPLNGECATGVGSFIVLNREGWILSSWHLQQEVEKLSTTVTTVRAYQAARSAIEGDGSLDRKEKARRMRKLAEPAKDAPQAFSVWWSWDNVRVVDIRGIPLPQADLLVGRLDPFDPTWIAKYPILKDPTKPLRQGTSLCRLGFPFPEAKATYDVHTDGFNLEARPEQLALFPIEGILTRFIHAGHHQQKGYLLGFIETSSPGLRGQSGGPIIDVHGTVWGLQSQTQHLYLDFDAQVPKKKGGGTEHQFLNVGWGTHPETVVGLLTEIGVAHTLSGY